MDSDEQRDHVEEQSVRAEDQAEREAPVFAYINVTTADGELVERIECSAWEYDLEMRRQLPIEMCRRNAVPTDEVADGLMRAYKKYDEAKAQAERDERFAEERARA